MSDATNARSRIQEVVESLLYRDLLGSDRRTLEQHNYLGFERRFGPRQSLKSACDLGLGLNIANGDRDEYQDASDLLRSFWRDHFKKPRYKSVDSMETDIDTLARLAIVNKQLIDTGTSHRVVLVTGSKKLVYLAYRASEHLRFYLRRRAVESSKHWKSSSKSVNTEYRKWLNFFGLNAFEDKTLDNRNWFAKFSLHYLRHISANANDVLVDKEEAGRLDDLFHGVFALRSERSRTDRTDIEDIVLHSNNLQISTLGEAPAKVAFDVLSQWDKLSERSIQERKALELEFPERAAEIIRTVIADESVTPESIVATIEEQVARQRDRSMLELSDLGAMSLLERRALAVRNPPDLYFATIHNTNEIFENLQSGTKYYNQPEQFIADYSSIQKDCLSMEETIDGDDRQHSYLKFLVLGAIFASAEKWGIALGHAERAINTVTRYKNKAPAVKETEEPDQESFISGREAYFLSAVCRRVLATNRGEAMRCLQHLELAEKAYSLDVRKRPSLARKLGAERHDCERLAIYLSAYYFDRYDAEEVTKIKKSCSDFDVTGVYESAGKLVEKLMLSHKEEDFLKGPMTFLTRVSIATNLIQVAVIKTYRSSVGCPDYEADGLISEQMLKRATIFLRSLSEQESAIETILVKAYRNAGAILLGKPQLSEFAGEEGMKSFFKKAEAGYSMRYDPWRFKALEDFLRRRLSNISS